MPGAVTLTQVEMQLVLQGTVEDFDQAGLQASLGAYLRVSPADISLDVSAASVNVKVTITFADASAARSVVDSMQGLTSNLAALSAAVGVTVEGATGPVVSQVVILAPSPSPLSPPPPSPPPLPPSPPPPPDSEARVERGEATLSTGAVVGVAVAMPFLVAALAAVLVMLLKYHRQNRRAARRQTSTSDFIRV
jgi:hypothetical protein